MFPSKYNKTEKFTLEIIHDLFYYIIMDISYESKSIFKIII
ncbi:hypothetical protein Sphch_3109 [Sphingobium chlorophenolicum L-1]|uniref:Uncharacterized protein n=1 Tax=Sphingobium chlorophenolicum L-1 TaxID=690566 RepID=F6F2R3_SPHCR|nr:hypothetical protein Sphch_3109 [Sphingobium chlorophenolicum L-1]